MFDEIGNNYNNVLDSDIECNVTCTANCGKVLLWDQRGQLKK